MRRNVIVTGGSRGIGEAVVRELVASGFQVGFTYLHNEQRALELRNELGQDRVWCAQMDVRSSAAMMQAFDELLGRLGSIQGLVNSAGVRQDQSFASMTDASWAELLNCNLNSVYHACKAVVPMMSKSRMGAIVNIASISGIVGVAGQTNYSASKAALIGFTKSLSKELGPRGIRVNVVAPGFIETDMTAKLSSDYVDELVDRIPLRRFGHSREVARVVRFLLTEDASYITGQVIIADGGLIA